MRSAYKISDRKPDEKDSWKT